MSLSSTTSTSTSDTNYCSRNSYVHNSSSSEDDLWIIPLEVRLVVCDGDSSGDDGDSEEDG